MRRSFWYISRAKLDLSAPANRPGLQDELSTELEFSPRTRVGDGQGILEKLAQVEHDLLRDPLVPHAHGIEPASPPLFFKFDGPTARLVSYGQLWIATVKDGVAVLLGGSATHAIGAPSEADALAISSSADPLGALRAMFNLGRATRSPSWIHGSGIFRIEHRISYIWAMIVSHGKMEGAPFTSLPYTRGMAVYAGVQDVVTSQFDRSGYTLPVGRIVVGSPLFIEQIPTPRSPTEIWRVPREARQERTHSEEMQRAERAQEPVYVPEEQPWFPKRVRIRPARPEFSPPAIDIVLVTVSPVELDAVLQRLEPLDCWTTVLKLHRGNNTYYLGQFGAFTAAVMKCGMGTVGPSATTLSVSDAIRTWEPMAVVMVGIAFGRDPTKQRIGDVLVAEKLSLYEPERLGEERIWRGARPMSGVTLLDRLSNTPGWSFLRPDGTPCKVLIGEVLSGEKLVDNPAVHAELFQRFPNAIGGEMEGAGLYAAAERAGTEWILVKGICDWADGAKTHVHQPLAAAAAVSLVHHALSDASALEDVRRRK